MDRRLAANPEDCQALLHRGWLSKVQGRLQDAVADLEHWRRLQPDSPEDDGMLIESYLDSGNLPAARLGIVSRQLDRTPSDRNALCLRGLLALSLGSLPAALDDFSRALAADPSDNTIRYHRHETLRKLGRNREALADLDRLVAGRPEDLSECTSIGRRSRRLWGTRPRPGPTGKPRIPSSPALPMNSTTRPGRWRPARSGSANRSGPLLWPIEPSRLHRLSRIISIPSGGAVCRDGRYAEAVEILGRSLEAKHAANEPYDRLYLSIAHHALGQLAQARTCLERAQQLLRNQPPNDKAESREITLLVIEAENLVHGDGAELPAEVFAQRGHAPDRAIGRLNPPLEVFVDL